MPELLDMAEVGRRSPDTRSVVGEDRPIAQSGLAGKGCRPEPMEVYVAREEDDVDDDTVELPSSKGVLLPLPLPLPLLIPEMLLLPAPILPLSYGPSPPIPGPKLHAFLCIPGPRLPLAPIRLWTPFPCPFLLPLLPEPLVPFELGAWGRLRGGMLAQGWLCPCPGTR